MAKKQEKSSNEVLKETAIGGGASGAPAMDGTLGAEGLAGAGAEAAGGAEGAAVTPSKRDAFRSRVSKRYPDLNMDDEDAYYDQMGGLMDEYEGYENNTERLRGHMKDHPAFAEMLLAAREQDDFDPVVWMVRERGLDLQSAMDDPEYADKIAQARAEYMKKEATGKDALESMKSNLPQTMEATQQALTEAGMGDKFDDVVAQIFQLADDITSGKWDPKLAVQLAKGGSYDADVAGARDEGMANGLNKKVDDKLRKLDGKRERVSGTQRPPKQKEPEKKAENMFMA